MNVEHKIALVTGGARRVGKAIAIALARSGARVIITYHTSADEAAITVAEIERSGGVATAVQCDQRDLDAIDRLFDRLRLDVTRLDILINNAAIMERQSALEITADDWSRVMDTNLRGPFFMAQRAAQWMINTGGGVIVNIADLSALHPWPSYLTHTISKSGLITLTQGLALALAPTIRVNAIAPGMILKPVEWSDDRWVKMIAALPLQREGTPDDVAEAVLYCVRSEFMTGQTIVIDGGRSLRV
ncbi:MAG TPA: SDR family oxidoreductase [Anaerolineae bacterium]|nr:SDR family oxidoreductase [Anaerolineae bacterium]